MASKQKVGKEQGKLKKAKTTRKVVPSHDFEANIIKKGWHVRGAA